MTFEEAEANIFVSLGPVNHLSSQHKAHFEKYTKQRAEVDALREDSRKKPKETQMKLFGAAGDGNTMLMRLPSREDPAAQAAYDKARVLFSAKTMTPFNALQHDYLYVEALLPKTHKKIKIKSGKTISRHTGVLADEIRREIMSIIMSVLEDGDSFYSFTTDMYKTRNMYSLISLTIHFVDVSLNPWKFVLYAEYFGSRRHTAQNILMALDTMMEEVGLNGPSVTRVMLLDNASNNKAAMRLGNEDYIALWCAIHTLQLSITDALKVKIGQVRVLKVAAKCKAVSKTVRRSEANRDSLKAACVSTNTRFIYPVKPGGVRWNSKEGNIASCLALKPALQHLSFYDTGDTWALSVPTTREFDIAEAVHKCLQPYKVATKLLEADRKSCLHQVIKQLYEIKCALEDMMNSSQNVKMFARNLLKQTEKRFVKCGSTNKWYAMAHLLDPELKGIILKEYGVFEKTVQDVKEMCRDLEPTPEGAQSQTEEPTADPTVETGESQNLSGVERLKRRRIVSGDIPNPPTAASRIDIEMDRYLNMKDEKCDDPLDWWRENKGSFQVLRKVAARIHSIPASSASSERVFSVGTRVRLKSLSMPVH